MHQNGFGILEKRRGLYDAAARVHQLVAFVRNLDDSIELVMRYKINDLFAKMMHVDDDVIKAVGNQILDAMLQQRLAIEGDQCFGFVLGECLRRVPRPAAKIIAVVSILGLISQSPP